MLCTITIDLFKGFKKIVSIAILSTPRLGESGSHFVITNTSVNWKPKLEQLEGVNQRYMQRYKNNAKGINWVNFQKTETLYALKMLIFWKGHRYTLYKS